MVEKALDMLQDLSSLEASSDEDKMVLILYEVHDKLLIKQLVTYKGFEFSDVSEEDLREFTKRQPTVLESKYGPPKVVNDGVTVAREVELEDSVENVAAKLVRQAVVKTNDLAGDGTTTSVVLAQGFIVEGVKVVAAGANPVLITRGIEKTAKALVAELKKMSKEVEDSELAYVADALNATKAAVEEGIVVGGGCTLLRLASKVDAIKAALDNDEEKNAGVNGSVVSEKVLSNENVKFGYNAATGKYEDLMAAGIIDPTKTLLGTRSFGCNDIIDCVVVEIKSLSQFPQATQRTTQDMNTEEIGE
ncbi:hypothetical protein Bca101_081158 [Brassica carinata]